MQTFLPYPDFDQTAKCLDMRRLGKQRVEAWQIYLALTEHSYGWKNHPAVKMWQGYEPALCYYGLVICIEWIQRGYRDTLAVRFQERCLYYEHLFNDRSPFPLPPWLGNEEFHQSHKSNLMRKNPEFYGKFFGSDYPQNLSYFWPTTQDNHQK